MAECSKKMILLLSIVMSLDNFTSLSWRSWRSFNCIAACLNIASTGLSGARDKAWSRATEARETFGWWRRPLRCFAVLNNNDCIGKSKYNTTKARSNDAYLGSTFLTLFQCFKWFLNYFTFSRDSRQLYDPRDIKFSEFRAKVGIYSI